MNASIHRLLFGAAFLFVIPSVADAGMPAVTLSDVARMRVQTISFFLAGFLISAWFIKLLWNYMQTDFPSLPRLGYKQALAIVALWGLVFVLVLTMISGARELMTPGAWEKQGATYKLVKEPSAATTADMDRERIRQKKLEALRSALLAYAQNHNGRFPANAAASDIPGSSWQLPEPLTMRYVYVEPTTPSPPQPLAYEPEIDGPERLVLFANGDIRKVHINELARLLPGKGR